MEKELFGQLPDFIADAERYICGISAAFAAVLFPRLPVTFI
jgi:hypothetical protein